MKKEYIEKIGELFRIRDRAVLLKDKDMFLSTQIGEISGSMSRGYLENQKQESEVLHVERDDQDPHLWIVLVREKYYRDEDLWRQGYLMYKLNARGADILITEIIW